MEKRKRILNRRDFLKGVGLAGGTALVSIFGDRGVREAYARPLEDDRPDSIINPAPPEENAAAYFKVEFESFSSNYFTSCTNMGSENELNEHKVVNQSGLEITEFVPGRLEYKDIHLERELTSDMEMWTWLADVDTRTDYRKNGSIVALDETYAEIARWDFLNAWPREVSAELKPSDADPNVYVLMEYTVLAVEEYLRVA